MARRTQGRKPRPEERSWLAPWLLLAAAVHGGLFLAVLAAKRHAELHSARHADGRSDPIWLELIADATVNPAVPEPADPEPKEAARVETARVAAAPREPATAARGGSAAGTVASTPSDTPEAAGNPGGPEASADGSAGSGPHLSLRDLGVGRGSNPFIGSVTDLPTERQLLNHRLRQSLRAEIARQDQARGLGPEGPAVTAVTSIVMASATAPNTTALLRVRTDGAGAVTLVDVLDSDRDTDEWRRIASELVRALAGKKLRVPAGSNGVSFQLRVVSRAQLPSGADPGLAVDVLGIPLKKGDGERSAKISILSPRIQEIEVPDSNGIRVPVVTFSLITGMGDLADVGAVARRLVTAYLVAMDTDYLLEKAPQPEAPPSSSFAPPSAPAGAP